MDPSKNAKTNLITAFISRWSDTIWVETRHIIPPPRRIISSITNLRSVEQLAVRPVIIRLLVPVDNSLASLLLTTALSTCLDAVCITVSENSGFLAPVKTSVAALVGTGGILDESVAEASWLWGWVA